MDVRHVDVCIVGAGFAGLAAAHALRKAAGTSSTPSIVVLEARDRVGGRAWNRPASDDSIISAGGTWIGKNQSRMLDLVKQVQLSVYPQYGVDPDDPDDIVATIEGTPAIIFRLDGVNHRYTGLFAPIGLDALAAVGLALEQLQGIAATVPIDRPWEAPNALALDSQTLGEWIASELNVPFEKARMLLHTTMTTLFSGDPSEVSLLGSMLLAKGGGKDGFSYYINSSLTEQFLVDGGAPEIARRMGDRLGDALQLSTPVRRIIRNEDYLTVVSDRVTVQAKYVIVAAPPFVASQIEYDPPLPGAHSQLMKKFLPGAVWKFVGIYDTPFWRDDGLTGQSTAPQSLIPVSVDASPRTPGDGSKPRGELMCFATGAAAVTLERMGAEKRKETVLHELALRFGPKAAHPRGYSETNWSTEQWSLGGMMGHLPTGVLTSYGVALHEPVGHLYWAGTERATEMHGLMEGAVRSGEKAAQDVLQALTVGQAVAA